MRQPLNIPLMLKNGEEGYKLVENYPYAWHTKGLNRVITVPEGFVYDGASVPRIVWTISGITPDGLIRAAALVHDFIYHHNGKLPKNSYGAIIEGVYVDFSMNKWSRNDADRLFARIMRESGVPMVKRRAAYLAVRAFGFMSW